MAYYTLKELIKIQTINFKNGLKCQKWDWFKISVLLENDEKHFQ